MEIPSIFLNRILSEAAKRSASDLHLSVGSLPMFRINNQLIAAAGEEIITSEILDKIISSIVNQEEAIKLKDLREIILVKEFASGFRFRINIFYQKNLPALSFHYIQSDLRTLDDLAAPKIFHNFLKLDSGLIVIAGSHNSGKTAVAAAFIEEINRVSSKYIITIEDPIEYLFVNQKSIIEQRQVGRDVTSAAAGLDYCLGEDVDLVYLSEVKKNFFSVVPLILELAAGNCLVILEVNADSAIRALEKILGSMESKSSTEAIRYSLADALAGIVAQKLVPGRSRGLILAAEILLVNSAVKSLIRENKIYQIPNAMQTFRQEGMISMDKALEELVKSGEARREDIS